MSEILSQGLKLIDILGVDNTMKVSDALSTMFGTGTQSNTYKINKALENILASIDNLESRNALTDVNATYVSESDGVEHFTGIVSELDQYNQGMVFIFTIPQNNKGAISININSIGDIPIKKYNNTGALVNLEADDFVRNHKYFIEYDGTQFVTLCENNVQSLKVLTEDLLNHIQDNTVHITSAERDTWNGKSVVTNSATNGSIKVDGVDVVVYTHPEGTNPHNTTKEDVGLGNVADERQYSEQNPPPYPVTSVNGEAGIVVLKASDLENDSKYQTDTEVASTVGNVIDSLKDNVNAQLDTLKKIADAINNDPNYHQTVDTQLNTKANKSLDNLDDGVLLNKGKEAGLLDSETASATYVDKTIYDADQGLLDDDIANLQTSTSQLNAELRVLDTKKVDKTELPNKVISVTLDLEGWQDGMDGHFFHEFTNKNITATDKLNVAPATDTMIGELVELGVTAIVAKNDNGAASIIFYGAKPTTELSFQVEIVPVKMIREDV